MQHSIHRVTGCEQTAPYTLRVRFEDGVSRAINFEPILRGELFGPLRDPEEFARVSIDPEVRTLVCLQGLISIQPYCMIGLNTNLHSKKRPRGGRMSPR